jgi:hypothetical protein
MRAEAFLRFGSLSSQKYKQWSRRKKGYVSTKAAAVSIGVGLLYRWRFY